MCRLGLQSCIPLHTITELITVDGNVNQPSYYLYKTIFIACGITVGEIQLRSHIFLYCGCISILCSLHNYSSYCCNNNCSTFVIFMLTPLSVCIIDARHYYEMSGIIIIIRSFQFIKLFFKTLCIIKLIKVLVIILKF